MFRVEGCVLLSFGRKFRVHGCVGFSFSSGLKDV
jgi:hypothetical protein